MQDFNQILDKLYFHDSNIDSVSLENADGLMRKLTVVIDYYNWEGNEENSGVWNWKKLVLQVEHCFHLRFISPSLIRDGFEITQAESLGKHDDIIKEYLVQKPNVYYNILKDKSFENTISYRFYTNSWGESIFGETGGFLEVAGFNVSITWTDEGLLQGQIHIPAKQD